MRGATVVTEPQQREFWRALIDEQRSPKTVHKTGTLVADTAG